MVNNGNFKLESYENVNRYVGMFLQKDYKFKKYNKLWCDYCKKKSYITQNCNKKNLNQLI